MEITHLLPIVLSNTFEYEQKHLVDHVHDLVVVVLESHLEIKTGELGQVPVGVGVLSPEDGANLVHPLHVGGDGHLLGQLRRLRQEGWTAEVVNLEDGGARLCGSGLKFWRLDLSEALGIEEGSEEVGDPSTDTKDGVGNCGTEVDNSVGKAGGLADTGVVGIGPGELSKGTAGILDLEWKWGRGGSNHMKLQIDKRISQMGRASLSWGKLPHLVNRDLDLVDGRLLDLGMTVPGLLDLPLYVDDSFPGEVTSPSNHVAGDLSLRLGEDCLDGGDSLPEDKEHDV